MKIVKYIKEYFFALLLLLAWGAVLAVTETLLTEWESGYYENSTDLYQIESLEGGDKLKENILEETFVIPII